MEFLRSLKQQFDALAVKLCLQGAGLRIVAAVDNAAVGAAGTAGYIVFLLQQADIQLVPAQLPCKHAADDTSANNGNIINHIKTSLVFSSFVN